MPDDREVMALWIAFRKGDSEAYTKIVNHFYTILYDYGSRLCKDSGTLEDCIHDLFLEIWQRRKYLSDTDYVKFYLLKALRRRIQDKRKNQQKWEQTPLNDTLEVEFFGEFSIETKIILQETNEHQLQKLRHILGKLTKREREVIYLKFYQELDYEQIAGLMSINYQSVRNLVHIAINQLKIAWQQN